MKLALAIRPALHVEAYYHCLAHLDLGRDAASLHRSSYLRAAPAGPRLRRRARALARVLGDHPDPIPLHLLPLWIDEAGGLATTLAWLRGGLVVEALAGSVSGAFGEGLAEVLEEEAPRLEREGWPPELVRIARAAPGAEAELIESLEPVLAGSFEALELLLHPARALEGAGRALPHLELAREGKARSGRVVLASHLPPSDGLEPLLFQILHELVHLLTDGLVAIGATRRSTREGEAGFGLHLRLEHTALAGGYQLLRRARPALLPRYVLWCAPFVLPAGGPSPREAAARAGIAKPAASFGALERVAAVDEARAVEAVLDDGLLVEETVLSRLSAALGR